MLVLMGNFVNVGEKNSYEKFDEIMTILEPIMTKYPVMMVPGDKELESYNNFFGFRYRFYNQVNKISIGYFLLRNDVGIYAFINIEADYDLYLNGN